MVAGAIRPQVAPLEVEEGRISRGAHGGRVRSPIPAALAMPVEARPTAAMLRQAQIQHATEDVLDGRAVDMHVGAGAVAGQADAQGAMVDRIPLQGASEGVRHALHQPHARLRRRLHAWKAQPLVALGLLLAQCQGLGAIGQGIVEEVVDHEQVTIQACVLEVGGRDRGRAIQQLDGRRPHRCRAGRLDASDVQGPSQPGLQRDGVSDVVDGRRHVPTLVVPVRRGNVPVGAAG